MESLKAYVYKSIDKYDDDKKSTIKVVLEYMKADSINVSDYCKIHLNKTVEEASSNEIIKHMILNSPFGYCYKKNSKYETTPIKRVLSYNEDFERDEIFNA